MRCSTCKTEKENVYVYTTNKYGVKYYRCRECNTNFMRKFRETEVGKKSTRMAVSKSIKKHHHKQMARLKVSEAIKKGTMIRPNVCSHCKENKKVEGHHEDYSKPLEVIWVCRQCHCELDKQMVK